MRNLNVAVITDSSALESMRADWNALLEDSASWTPFLTWEWIWAWWSHVQEGATLVRVGTALFEGLEAAA